ncbi:MAG: hypothetical protein KAF42_02015 [Sphingopyxis terrae]|nr:hypothetical protein [Sphingopyxis terrae]
MSAAIVKLPTAARRQVKQPCNKRSREAKMALRDAQPVDFDFQFPTVREAEKIAKAIHPMTPERWLLLGLLHVMPAEQFARLAHFGAHGNPAVLALLKLAKGNVGLNLDVMAALERLDQ